MDIIENAAPRQSRIPHPRAPAVSGLQEMTESQHNARSQLSAMRIPAPTGIKRPGTELQLEPETKRQTLVERAGEYNGQRSVAVSAFPPSAMSTTCIKGVSIAAIANKKTKPMKPFSTNPSRLASGATLVAPSGSFALSVGPAAGRQLHQSTRVRQRPHAVLSRPATALDQYDTERLEEASSLGKKKKTVLDVDERLREVESQFYSLKDVMNQSLAERKSLEEVVELAKTRADDIHRQRDRLEEKNTALQKTVDSLREQLQSTTMAFESERREKTYKLEDQARDHKRELDDLRRELKDELARIQQSHCETVQAMERHYKTEKEDERDTMSREMSELKAKLDSKQQDLHLALLDKDRELQQSRAAVDELKGDLDKERCLKGALQLRLTEASSTNLEFEERARALQARVDFLKSDSKQQSDQFAEMETRMQQALKAADDARQKLIKEETERRMLFNKYQELKGNIRVMCRVRPALQGTDDEEAKISFPDAATSSTQIDLTGPEEKSSIGNVCRKTIPFEFDRVFAPGAGNEEVFGEISQLVQSALDGYNVCIFCYGQTGSGKTYTMSSPDGVIPRATHMIYDNIKRLEEKSWTYSMDGSFIEVYNEELHDLLGSACGGGGKEVDMKRKLEIRHDEAHKSTTVMNCRTVQLDSPEKVEVMLRLAQSNRSVAATKANERSSRSHSVFILKLTGENAATKERCEGTLNLVDLAGSERLKQSGAEGDRKKETQNINKSLACLGDVIEALGRGAPHVPYRNSKLTHLLQYSLGGNSKTLMFVMVSPLEAHLKETLTSLRFATKVHNTHIGTAKSTKKIKDRPSDI